MNVRSVGIAPAQPGSVGGTMPPGADAGGQRLLDTFATFLNGLLAGLDPEVPGQIANQSTSTASPQDSSQQPVASRANNPAISEGNPAGPVQGGWLFRMQTDGGHHLPAPLLKLNSDSTRGKLQTSVVEALPPARTAPRLGTSSGSSSLMKEDLASMTFPVELPSAPLATPLPLPIAPPPSVAAAQDSLGADSALKPGHLPASGTLAQQQNMGAFKTDQRSQRSTDVVDSPIQPELAVLKPSDGSADPAATGQQMLAETPHKAFTIAISADAARANVRAVAGRAGAKTSQKSVVAASPFQNASTSDAPAQKAIKPIQPQSKTSDKSPEGDREQRSASEDPKRSAVLNSSNGTGAILPVQHEAIVQPQGPSPEVRINSPQAEAAPKATPTPESSSPHLAVEDGVTRQAPAAPLRELTLQISRGGEVVDIQVKGSGQKVEVSVATNQDGLASTLRHDLPTLMDTLRAEGYEAGHSVDGVSAADEDPSNSPDSEPHDQNDHDQQASSNGNDSEPQRRPKSHYEQFLED